MAKLTRVPAKVFAASAAADEIGQFGSAVAGSKLETSDVATIQGLSAWLSGWSEALVSGNRYPALQEMNGLLKVLSYQGAYALQEGIPEYDSATTYYVGSIVKKTGTFELYGSLTDDNVGNALTVDTEWKFLVDLANISGGGANEFDPLGTVTTNITLAENMITTGYWSGTNTITLPTITDTEKQVVCILDFTTATSSQPTITNTNLKWSDKNGGKPPSAYSTLSGVQNVLVFKSVWISSTLYWEVEYSSYGGVETAFVQPVLSANGTLGGASFAVYSSSVLSAGCEMYKAYDNNTSTYYHSASGLPTLKFYNPAPLKVSELTFTNDSTPGYYITGFSLYGSNDDSIYTLIGSYTNSNGTGGASWSKSISNTEFYNYYRINITSTTGNTYCSFAELDITAVYIAT